MNGTESAHLGMLAPAVERRLAVLDTEQVARRIWDADPTVWKDDPDTPEIRDRLGWLHLPDSMARHVPHLHEFAAAARAEFDRLVLCGMGGSSLAPEVLWRSFGARAGFPALHMLDSTDPRAVHAVLAQGDLARTLFLVSSKSGSTLETDSAMKLFWQRSGERGAQFAVITDPGTSLSKLATDRRYRRAFLNPPDIGGRYSALSLFGLVPAAILGIDAGALLERGARMASACAPAMPAAKNPGLWLGAVLAEAALAGRDKLTLLCAPPLASFGLWVEQLVAESTGKEGRGIVPVCDEPVGPPSVYGHDRVFVSLVPTGAPDPNAAALDALSGAGHPVIRLVFADALDLGAEFFRWEMATAVAGAVLRINAFDQPNVAESKKNTLEVLAGDAPSSPVSTVDEARAMLQGCQPGDYVALLAYLPPGDAYDRQLTALRTRIRDRYRIATTVGYGPRYLHSTGQLHKGGPRRGHFLQITSAPPEDVAIPGEKHTFARLEAAQAEGDLRALRSRGLPALRIDGLDRLESL